MNVSARIKFSKKVLMGVAFCLTLLCMVTAGRSAWAAADLGEEGTDYVSGEMLVVFKDGTSAADAQQSLWALDEVDASSVTSAVSSVMVDEVYEDDSATTGDLRVMDAPDTEVGGSFVQVDLVEGVSVEQAVEQAESDPAVAYAQPNYKYELIDGTDTQDAEDISDTEESVNQLWSYTESALGTLSYTPNDMALKNLKPESTMNAWHLNTVNAFSAWEIGRASHAVTVAVMDTGCIMDHEDLKANVLTQYARAFTSSSSDAGTTMTGDEGDFDGHGTHVSGIIAATANNVIGTAGVSYNAYILPLRVFEKTGSSTSTAYTSSLVKAYNYLIKITKAHPELNIHVVNISAGGYRTYDSDDEALEAAIASAEEVGIVTVCSAGNGNTSKACYPSDYEECISVTALTSDGVTPATYSDYGEAKDIAAPGGVGSSNKAGNVYSTYCAYTDSNGKTSYYTFLGGTSMAAPVVSGSLALLWSINPDLTVEQAKQAIYSTAYDISEPADREGLYGAGGLDLKAAAESVARLVVSAPSSTVEVGKTLQMSTADSLGYDYASFTWSVENGLGAATIDAETGVLTGTKLGGVTVTATWKDDPSVSASCSISVTNPDSLYKFSPDFYAGAYYLVTYAGTVPQGQTPLYKDTPLTKVVSGDTVSYVFLVDEATAATLSPEDFSLGASAGEMVTRDGDVSGNGVTNIVDVQVAYDLATGVYGDFSLLPETGWIAADYNNDEVVNALDAQAIQHVVFSR